MHTRGVAVEEEEEAFTSTAHCCLSVHLPASLHTLHGSHCVSVLACVWRERGVVIHSAEAPGRESCGSGRSQRGFKALLQLSRTPLVAAAPSPYQA